MRSEWLPVSAAALVTGVMALILGQMLNPGGSESSPAGQMLIAAEYPGRWLAMSVLFFGGASALVLGMPAVLSLFQQRRGRGLGLTGVAVFTVGCVGVGGLAALMLMFRALALQTLAPGAAPRAEDITMVTASLEDPGLTISLGVWVYGFMAGVLLIALGLFRSKQVPGWVPGLLMGFLAVQVVVPLLGEGTTGARIASAVGLILLAGGFTGIATNATSERERVPLTQSLA
jgi:hypothetical protein